MFHLAAIFVVTGACAVFGSGNPPPYVQSKTSFFQVSLYLQEHVPYDSGDIHNVLSREHHAYGMIVAVTSALVSAYRNRTENPYDPLRVLYETVPKAWHNYNDLAAVPLKKALFEAQTKVQPIITLEDTLCDVTKTVDDCNENIDRRVANGPSFLKNRAELLVALGTVSDVILGQSAYIDRIAKKDHQIPYLLHNVESEAYTDLIQQLDQVFELLRRKVNYNRLNN